MYPITPAKLNAATIAMTSMAGLSWQQLLICIEHAGEGVVDTLLTR